MASIGTASLTIVPKFDNLGKSVTSALGGVSTSSVGKSAGKEYSSGFETGVKGLGASGAVIGAFSAVTQSAMSLISSSVGNATNRLDTLNQYPRVMESLGYSSEEASDSIDTMSEHLTGLPTALDDMTSTVQGIAAVTGDLTQATDAGLALNDMLLAAGSSTTEAASASEQFRQMLAKGTPEMQEWKSLTSAMPGQMKQLAEEMLGAGSTASDLYAALGGGGEEATITTEDLLEAMVRLDTEGGDGITSFAEQAKDATGGIESSMENMQTAVSRGLADIMEAVGTDTISSAFGTIGTTLEDALGGVADVVSAVMPAIKDFAGALSELSPAVIPVAASLVSLAAAGKGLNSLAGILSGTTVAFSGLKNTASVASESLLTLAGSMKSGGKASEGLLSAATALSGGMGGAVVAGIGAAAVAVGLIAAACMDAKEKAETFEKATTGLTDAVADASALDNVSASIGAIGDSAEESALSVDELAESMAAHADTISESAQTAATEMSTLETARQVISDYAGETDLSTDAQGRLEWAIEQVNDQLGLSITASDVAKNSYRDQNDEVVNLKDSINDLVEAKKNEIRTESLTESLSEAYEAQTEAAETLAEARKNAAHWQEQFDWAEENADDPYVDVSSYADNLTKARKELEKATELYDTANASVESLEEELGDTAKAASDSADAYDSWANGLSALFEATLQDGTTLAGLKDDLRDLSASTEELDDLSEDSLFELADAYDGTSASIVGVLDGLGIEMDDTARDAAYDVLEIRDAIEDMGLSLEDMDTSAFSQKLADAGVSTEDLNEIGTDNLDELAEACEYDMDSMIFFIEHYNDADIVDKDGNITVDDADLIDAEGDVYTWNGTELLDKDGKAVVDDVDLLDGQGNVLTWNGTELKSKSATAKADGNAVDGSAESELYDTSSAIQALKDKSVNVDANGNYSSAADKIWNLGSAIKNLTSKTVKVVTKLFGSTSLSGNAAESTGVGNAAGGIRYHASGAIATKAVPLDIVGEDGAEAIVPLTNERYSLPFAQLIAGEIEGSGTPGNTWNVQVTVDGAQNPEEWAAGFVRGLRRQARMV